ncbi:MAG: hypothetical protein K0S06_4141 [Microvirga sp.]|nr:hypothetical protein [Microvirga sp.]
MGAKALPDQDARKAALQGAWTRLSDLHGGPRSVWILRETRPANFDVDPRPTPDALVFPALDVAKPPGFTAPPRVRVMPDRFVVVCYRGGKAVHTAIGRAIPDDLLLGPDPLQLQGSMKRDPADGTIAVDPRLAWLFDHEKAVEAGLGISIALTPADVEAGFERIVAVGFKASAAPEDGAALLTELFEAHAYGRGIDIVPQGTPTNNTAGAPSGFTSDYKAAESLFDTAVANAGPALATEHHKKSDGQRLAETLSLPLQVVKSWPNAGRMDVAEALLMNRALVDATLRPFLRDWLSPQIGEARRETIERFFLGSVTGRGLAPAFRVGRQPYGVIVTTALDRWRWARAEVPRGDESLEELSEVLFSLRTTTRSVLSSVARIGAADSDHAALLKTIGLQASSVEWASRKAVSDEVSWAWLNFDQRIDPAWRPLIWAFARARKLQALVRLGLDPEKISFDDLTFVDRLDELASAPVVDGEPTVPLSETAGIRPFDGDRNYIHWLASASRDDIEAERLEKTGGGTAAAPRALLYKYLRHAVLDRIEEASERVFRRLAAIELGPTVATWSVRNVNRHEAVRSDFVQADAAKLGLSTQPMTLGHQLLENARVRNPFVARPPEARRLAEADEALAALAGLPTARLERLFAEHMDLVSHRLDAWLSGLVAQRHETLRRQGEGSPAIHLAAYGVVEGYRPRRDRPTPVPPEELLPGLVPQGAGAARDPANAGYVLAPSLAHGVTAAVLLNAHVSSGRRTRPETMAINLSSARVRAAMALVEGLRNGQELGALLGYTLERRLHENPAALELDLLISLLRERFPFTSKRLTDVPDGEPAEAIEARNVVDGYGLVNALRERPALQGELDALAGGGAKAAALRAAIGEIQSSLDALGDLFTAESVHQVVQGNMERARGTIQAVTEGDIPPVPDIVETSRTGRLVIERLALHLPEPGGAWTAPPTPRAAAEPRVDRWLTTILPDPAQIGATVTDPGGVAHPVAMSELALSAIDLVLASGDSIGEGASEIERLVLDAARRLHGVPDEAAVAFRAPGMPAAPAGAFVVDSGVAATGVALAAIHPMLTGLRRLLGRCRALNAEDWRLASKAENAVPGNPRGLVAAGDPPRPSELEGRVEAAKAAFDVVVQNLAAAQGGSAVKAEVEALRGRETSFDPADAADQAILSAWTPRLAALAARLRALVLFGLPEAVPAVNVLSDPQAIIRIHDQAAAVLAIAAKRVAEFDVLMVVPPAPPATDAGRKAFLHARVDAAIAAGRALFGRSMPVVPRFELSAADLPESAAARAAPAETDPLAIEGWLQSLSRVRENVGELGRVLASIELLGKPEPALVPVQLPNHAGAPWAAKTLGTSNPRGETLSIVAIDPPGDLSLPLAGLLIDEWTELVPGDTETIGISFQYDRPNATAPQALLVALCSRDTGPGRRCSRSSRTRSSGRGSARSSRT